MTMKTHKGILDAIRTYLAENRKFETRGVKVSGVRARKALGDLVALARDRKHEIQEKKNSMSVRGH